MNSDLHPNQTTQTDATDHDQVCILWHRADGSPAATPSESLIRVLKKRGFAVAPVSSKHAVFAAACRYAKTARRVVIVLDDRASLVGVDRVLDGLDRFSPGVICWEYVADANPPMVPVVRMSSPIAGDPRPKEPAAQPDAQPVVKVEENTPTKLRLVQEASGPEAPSVQPNAPMRASDVLNADELDALLAGEVGESRRGK
tara:strand:- start:524 stop:1123 length:600 start_codon:yes stop_codon:yes gene_type:complete